MRLFEWQKWTGLPRQRIIAILLLVAVIAALLPIPILTFQPTAAKDRSRPFPCQDRPCGCRSAEQCKKKCCCFSAGQKLAWAKRNGVKPSEVVPVATKCETSTIAKNKSCCTTRRASIAQSKTTTSKPMATKKMAPRHTFVIGVVAQDCQGIAQTLFGQAIFLIPPMVSLTPMVEPTGERLIPEECRIATLTDDPPIPPPRVMSA